MLEEHSSQEGGKEGVFDNKVQCHDGPEQVLDDVDAVEDDLYLFRCGGFDLPSIYAPTEVAHQSNARLQKLSLSFF